MRKILFEETILELLYRLSPDVYSHTNSLTGEILIVVKTEDRFTEYEAYFTHDAFIDFIDSFQEQVSYKMQFEGVESVYMFIAEIIRHIFTGDAIPAECCYNTIIRNGLVILHIEDSKSTIKTMKYDTVPNIVVESNKQANTEHVVIARNIIDTLLM